MPKRILEARTRSGLSQVDLGVQAGLDPSVASPRINQYERGRHAPTYTTLALLGSVLGVPVAYFYCENDDLASLILAYAGATERDRRKALLALHG